MDGANAGWDLEMTVRLRFVYMRETRPVLEMLPCSLPLTMSISKPVFVAYEITKRGPASWWNC